MKIMFLTSGRDVPSTRYRLMPFVTRLRELGHACIVASSRPAKYESYRALGWRLSRRLQRAVRGWHLLRARFSRPDVIVIERELFDDESCDLERRFRALGAGLVLDVDDAVFLRYRDKFEKLAALADVVIAGNDELLGVIEPTNSRVVVIPTCVDPAQYQLRQAADRPTGPIVLGWIGTSSNLGQLDVVAPALRAIAGHCQYVLRVVSDRVDPLRDIDLTGVSTEFVPWHARTATAEIAKFDVGLMPLQDTEWNRFKCGFKLLQYMASGVPAVASPVGANCQIIRDGVDGFLPSSDDAWRDVLLQVVSDEGLRRRIGEEGRRTAKTRYSITTHEQRFVSALENARQRASRRDSSDDD